MKIITVCGSLRFTRQMMEITERRSYITPTCAPKAQTPERRVFV